MNRFISVALAALALSTSATVVADDNLWFGVKAGTLGLGVEAAWRPVPFLDVRAGYNGFTYEETRSEAGINYDGELDLSTVYATANLRVPLSPFRVTAGVFSNGNEVILKSRDNDSFTIGGTTYQLSEVGSVEARGSFDDVVPYAGIGFDFRIADTVGLSLDAGVLFQGAVAVNLDASGPITNDQNFLNELEAERQQLQDELGDYEHYPVISLGFNVNF